MNVKVRPITTAIATILAASMVRAAQGNQPRATAPAAPAPGTQNVNVVKTPTVNVGTLPAVTLSGTPTINVETLPTDPHASDLGIRGITAF